MNCYPSTDNRGIEAILSRERILGRPKEGQPENGAYKKVDYATPADFCQVFDEHLNDLYTLSLVLTADRHKADECVVAGLEDCLQGNPVFREWAKSWARRTVIKNAIRVVSPLTISPSRSETETTAGSREPLSKGSATIAAITRLQPFDRFVYVLSVLEKYSNNECSMLLDCTVERVVDARIRALQQFGGVGSGKVAKQTAPTTGAA